MDANVVMQYVSYLLIAIGVMAFLVSVITQVIKELPGLAKLPTSAVVFVLSLIMCPACMFAMLDYISKPITWYLVFACMVAAFIVALVAMNGWDAVRNIWNRTQYKDK